MGRTKGSGKGIPITQPKGARIDLDPKERARLMGLRTGAGLTQLELAARAGISAGTISNVETGTAQVKKTVYVKLLRALHTRRPAGSKEDEVNRATLAKIAENAAVLEQADLDAVAQMVERLANARKPKDT